MDIDRAALWAKIGYEPHPKQLLFHNSEARFKIPVCGRRFGKSKMAAAEMLPELFKKAPPGEPPLRYWIIGPTYTLGEKEFRYLWEFVVNTLKLGPHLKRKAYNERTGEMFIEMPWGTRVDVKSADHPDGLVGEGLSGVIMSEAAKQKKTVWDKYVRPALADKHGWAIFPSTPEGFNWYHDLYMLGQDPDYKDYESWNFPSWENKYVYPGGFEDPEIQGQHPSDENAFFWQEIGADFRSFVGKIYTEWDDSVHIIDGYQYNPEWPNYMFFDFGFSNPFVGLDAQVSPSGKMYIWREYYVKELTVSKHAQELLHRNNPPGYQIRCGFGDSADPGAIETLATTLCPTYGSNDAKADWNRGIQEVKKLLQVNDEKEANLYVARSCVNTIFEFQNYRIKQTARDDENPREDPKKWADHAMDALRYGVMHLYVLGARYHLSDMEEPVYSASLPRVADPSQSLPAGEGRTIFTRELDEAFTLSGRTTW